MSTLHLFPNHCPWSLEPPSWAESLRGQVAHPHVTFVTLVCNYFFRPLTLGAWQGLDFTPLPALGWGQGAWPRLEDQSSLEE